MKVNIPASAAGERLSDYLARSGYRLAGPCGGRGTCGKCRVKTSDGRTLLACRTVCPPEGLTVFFDEAAGEGLTVEADDERIPETCSLALDVGTTTLALAAVDPSGGRVFAARSCLNPQHVFGADVITRIGRSGTDLAAMQACVAEAVRDMASGLPKAEKMTVAGNPTMLSLLAGVSPEPMGRAPFTPAFIARQTFSGQSLGLPAEEVFFLPGASAFVGADVLAGILHTGMLRETAPVLLMDVGTNGEMAVWDPAKKKLTVTSAAAGPALEGADISCGIGGVKGAVNRVKTENGRFYFETVGGEEPRGLCGSGLIDLVACLLKEGYVDETGFLEDDPFVLRGFRVKNGNAAAAETEALTLTQKDIRALQLAKAAVRAGLETLLDVAGIPKEALSRVYLAGGMGSYVSGLSAARIGLIPARFLPVLKPVGNSALAGAVDALKDPAALDEIAACAETVALNDVPAFSDRFIDEMIFPEEEE